MADYSDGSMIVNTEIDTDGFLKDSDKLKKAIASLTRQVDSIGQQMKTAIAKNNTAALETLNRKFAESQAQAEALRGKLEAFARVKILNDEYVRVTNEIEKADTALKHLYERQEKMKAVGSNQQFEKWQKLQSDIGATNTQLDEYETKLEAARKKIQEMSSPEAYKQLSHASAAEIEAHHASLAKAREEYAALSRTVADLSNKIGELYEQEDAMKASGADKGSAAWRSLQYDIDRACEKLEQLNVEREKMESSGSAGVMGGETSQFQQMNETLSQTEEHLDSLNDKKERALASMPTSGIGMALAEISKRALRAAVSLAKMAGNGALSFLRKLASNAKNAAIQLMKLSGRAISSGIRQIATLASRAGKAILGLGRSTKQSSNGINVGLQTLMKYGLGIRTVFALVKRLRTTITDAFKNMATNVSEVNDDLSSLVSSLNQVKNSLATAFQPIVSAVTPYLTQFMDKLTEAMTKLGEFFSAITGQTYVYKATKAQTNYAESLDNTASSASNATRQLAKFDDLNVLTNNNSSSSESDSDSTGGFEKVSLVGDVSDFIKSLKDAFNAGDFWSIGETIANKINEVFSRLDEWISWENIGDKITQIITAITDTINSLVSNLDWELIGRTFGSGINTVVNTLYLLATQINWTAIGESLATGLNSLVDRVDWDNLGRLFAAKFNIFIDTIHGFVSNFEWGNAGTSFATAVSGLVDEVHWGVLRQDIVDSINGVLTMLQEFVGYFEWGKYGTSFADNVNKIVDEVHWDDLGGLLRDSMKGALEFLYSAVSKLEWGNTGVKFSNALNAFFVNDERWSLAGKTIDKSIKGLLDFTKNAVITFDEEQFAEDVKDVFKNVDWTGIANATWSLIKTTFSKAGSFLDALFSEDISDDAEKRADGSAYWQSYVDGVNSFNSKSLASKIGAKLAEAISSVPWEKVGETFSDGAKKLFNAFTDFFTELTKKGDDGKSAIEAATDEFAEGVDWDGVTDAIFNAAKSFFTALGQSLGRLILNGIFDVLTDKEMEEGHQKVLDQAEERAEKTGVSLSTAYLQVGESVADSYYAGMKNRAENTEDVAPVFESAMDMILSAADPETRGMSEAEQFYSGFKNTVLDESGAVKEEFASVVDEIFLPSELEALSSGEMTAESFAEAFETGTKTVGGDATQALTDFFNLVFASQDTTTPAEGLGKGFADGFVSGVDKQKEETQEDLTDIVDSVLEGVKTDPDGLDEHSPSKRAEGYGKNFMEGFTVGMEGQGPDANNRSKTLFDGIFDTIITTADAMQQFQTIILNALNNLEKFFPLKLESYKTLFETGWTNINDVTTTGWSVIQSSVLNALKELQYTIPSELDSIVDTIENQSWWSVGDNIVAGIQDGISSNWPWLRNTVEDLAWSLYETARNALGIHSPSTLFRDGVGEMLGLGVAEGMEDSQPAILDTVSDVADAMANEMQDADVVANIDASNGDLDTTLATFSDKVTDSFSKLVNRLEEIAESVTFQMPDASGTVVPYSVSANLSGSSAGANSDNNDDQINALIEMFNNQTSAIVQAIEEYCGVEVRIGDKVIGDAAISEINRRTRSTGKSPILV